MSRAAAARDHYAWCAQIAAMTKPRVLPGEQQRAVALIAKYPTPEAYVASLPEDDTMPEESPATIDMTPTWGEVGLLCLRLALSNEQEALRHAAPEIGRAFGMAHALSALWPDLSEEQRAKAAAVIKAESAKAARAYE